MSDEAKVLPRRHCHLDDPITMHQVVGEDEALRSGHTRQRCNGTTLL